MVRQAEPPGETPITFSTETGYVYPHRCEVASFPALIREDIVVDEIDGQIHTFAHELDRWTAVEAFADEYQGGRHPRDGPLQRQARVGDALSRLGILPMRSGDLNFVRSDGKTLVAAAAPAFRPPRTCGRSIMSVVTTLQSPLTLLREMSPADRETAPRGVSRGLHHQSLAIESTRPGGGRPSGLRIPGRAPLFNRGGELGEFPDG